jgi:nucleotide-binding universal stress UspA family protein
MMKVYAYIDRSHFAESVWQHALWAARQLDAAVELIHVIDQPVVATSHDYSGYFAVDAPDVAVEERIRLDEAQNRLLIQEGRQLLDAVTESVRAAGMSRVSQRLFHGTVLDHLQQHAHEAVLVVVGKRGEGANQDSQHLGRNIERVVRSAHTPVLIAAAEFSPIVSATIAWDGGKSSGEAIHFLAMQPLLREVRAVLLHVGDQQRVPPALHDARAHLQGAGLQVDIDVLTGAAAEAILAGTQRRGAELLVIGAYGHSRIRHLVVGSTTTEILMRATTSVLVFH